MDKRHLYKQPCPYCGTILPYKGWRNNAGNWIVEYGKCTNKDCRVNKDDVHYSGFNFETYKHPQQETLE